MSTIYRNIEITFEKLTGYITTVLGNPITFILALILVIIWFTSKEFYTQEYQDIIRDVIHAFIFLCLFIIQKGFNRHTASLHLKVNELVTSHEPARNEVIHVGEKTEHEIIELSKEYAEIAENIKLEEAELKEIETAENQITAEKT